MSSPKESNKYAASGDQPEEPATGGLVYSAGEEAPLAKSGAERNSLLKESVLEDKDTVLEREILKGSPDTAGVLSPTAYEAAKPSAEDGGKEQRIPHRQGLAERDAYRLDVEEPTDQQIRYGTVEQGEDAPVVRANDRKVYASSVNPDESARIRESLKAPAGALGLSKTEAYLDTLQERRAEAGPARLRPVEAILRRTSRDMAAVSGGEDLDERVGAVTRKYSYHAGKYAALGGVKVVQGTVRTVRLGKRVVSDLKDKTLTMSGATKALLNHGKSELISAAGTAGGVIKEEAAWAAEDFRGSEDWGIQTIVRAKDTFVTTKYALKGGQRGVRAGKWLAEKAGDAIRRVASAVKKLLTSPVVIKGSLIALGAAAGAAAGFFLFASCSSLFLTLSLKSENADLSKAYLYITELDARMEDQILTEDKQVHDPSVDVYGYYVNGTAVSKGDISVYTNADLILAYLDSKYDDYSFSGVITGLFGTTVKDEIRSIHQKLHQVQKVRWKETVHNDDGTTDTVYHLDIYLTTQSWETYYNEHRDELLTADQQEQYETLREVGVYTFRKELSSPFPGIDWSDYVSSRWGWRIHPITGELKQHLGLDIAMPGDTPVSACNSGRIESGYDENGWGNYVNVISGDGSYTLYGHLNSVAVSSGQTVNAGDVIGYVGTTGASTGNHLHLEYHRDGENLNPLIFTACDITQEGDNA